MGKNKVLVKVHPEGKYVVDIDKDIDVAKLTTGARVALRNDSYTLHLVLPTKVRPSCSIGLLPIHMPWILSCASSSTRQAHAEARFPLSGMHLMYVFQSACFFA